MADSLNPGDGGGEEIDGGSAGIEYGEDGEFLHGGGSGGIAQRPGLRLSIYNPALTPDSGTGI